MNDREFLKLFSGLMGALIALTVVLLVLANVVAGRHIFEEPDTSAVVARIKPVGALAVGEAPAPRGGGANVIASANAAEPSGKAVFDQSCAACHATGVAGAPRIGDQAAWKERMAKGMDTLYKNAIQGFQGDTGFMPPKGGNASLTDAQVKAAVEFMVTQSK